MTPESNIASDEASANIRRLIEDWAEAVRNADLSGVLRQHSQDILMFDLPGPTQLEGIEAYKESWPPLFQWLRGAGAFNLSDIKVTAGEDVAFVTALLDCRGTDATGAVFEIEGRLTIGLRKIDGQWIVTHEHHSEPSA